jgi:hypothetical protein
VGPLLLLLLGLAMLVAGIVALRSFGPGYRVGRLFAAAPRVSVADALRMAGQGSPRLVQVAGRIDSDEEFEDAAHSPLVLRRSRVQLRRGDRWETVEDSRELVPFTVGEGLESIRIDGDALDVGLVVVPREAVGVAADIPDRVPEGTPPEIPARVWVEQVSSVEHVIVIGVPTIGPDGVPWITAGLGRPLVMSTLEPPEAMRLLGGGSRGRAMLATVLLVGGPILAALAIGWGVISALA